MVRFLRVGIVAAFTSFVLAAVTACSGIAGEPGTELRMLRFRIVAQCIGALAASLDERAELEVVIYDSTANVKQAVVPDWLDKAIADKRVRVLRTEPNPRPGVSMVAVYLDRVGSIENGEEIVSFSEVYSLSEKFLHEFSVEFRGGDVKRASLVRTTQL